MGNSRLSFPSPNNASTVCPLLSKNELAMPKLLKTISSPDFNLISLFPNRMQQSSQEIALIPDRSWNTFSVFNTIRIASSPRHSCLKASLEQQAIIRPFCSFKRSNRSGWPSMYLWKLVLLKGSNLYRSLVAVMFTQYRFSSVSMRNFFYKVRLERISFGKYLSQSLGGVSNNLFFRTTLFQLRSFKSKVNLASFLYASSRARAYSQALEVANSVWSSCSLHISFKSRISCQYWSMGSLFSFSCNCRLASKLFKMFWNEFSCNFEMKLF